MKEYKKEIHHFTTEDFSTEKPFVEIACPHIQTNWIPAYKSELTLGNLTIRFTKKFNWFNRKMLKLIFGLDIKNIKEGE